MALEQILTLTAQSAECVTQTYLDETVYGGAELLRNQVAVIIEAQKSQLPNEVDIPLDISGNDSDPETDIEWSVTSEYDGWHTLPMYIIPVYDGAGNYTPAQVVYYLGALWINIQAASGVVPGTDPDFWVQVTLADDRTEIEAADNVQYEYMQFVPTCRIESCYSKATALEAAEGCCEGCNATELKQISERLFVLLNGIFVNCQQMKYAEAEEVVRNATHICEKSKCICD